MRPWIVALVLLLPTTPGALDPWTWQDSAGEAVALGMLAADYGTTRDLVWRNHHRLRGDLVYPEYNEGNPFLGRHPSYGRTNAYFLSAALVHVGVARLLPAGWRRAWHASVVGVELMVLRDNYQANLRVRF